MARKKYLVEIKVSKIVSRRSYAQEKREEWLDRLEVDSERSAEVNTRVVPYDEVKE